MSPRSAVSFGQRKTHRFGAFVSQGGGLFSLGHGEKIVVSSEISDDRRNVVAADRAEKYGLPLPSSQKNFSKELPSGGPTYCGAQSILCAQLARVDFRDCS